MKIIFLVSFLLLLLPFISADVILPFSTVKKTLPYFLLILVIEVIIFWLLTNKVFKIKTRFWKSLLIVFIANAVSSLLGSLLGTFLEYYYAFVLSVFIEFGVYLLFFTKKKFKKINLLWISLAANFLSYLVLFLLLESY